MLDAAGLPGAEVVAQAQSGGPVEEIKRAHLREVEEHSVFGVPTFVLDGRAVFVRLTTRPEGDRALARRTIEGVLRSLEEQPELDEFKATTRSR